MASCFIISLGSNLPIAEAEAKLAAAQSFLRDLLSDDILFSSQYSTPGVGSGVGKTYVNSVAFGLTSLTEEQIIPALKAYEIDNGRDLETKRQGIVPIDIDLLIFGENIIKPRDLSQSYVTRGLREIKTTVSKLSNYIFSI